MLHPAEVKAGQLFRYTPKGQELGPPVPPGVYLATFNRIPKAKRKAAGGTIATDPARSRVFTLFPNELYVRRLLTGLLLEDGAYLGKGKDLSLFTQRDYWDWQRRFLADAQCMLKAGRPYRRALIAPVGAGKTLPMLELAALFMKARGVAVAAAPGHLHYDWERLANKYRLPCPIVTTYEGLAKIDRADALFLDEAFAVSNPDTKRFKHAKRLAATAQVAVAMTGTPRSVGVQQLRWAGAIYPGIIPEPETAFKFCYGRTIGEGFNQSYKVEEWDVDKLITDLTPILMTISRDELEAVLPPLSVEQIRVPRFARWEQIAKGAACATGSKPKIRAQCLTATDGHVEFENGTCYDVDDTKLRAVRERVESSGEPVLIVAHWRRSQERLAEVLADFNPAIVSDHVTAAEQLAGRRRFEEGKTDVLICSAGMALGMDGLQDRCSLGYIMSNSSSPIMRTQLFGRLQRPGQTKPVRFYDIVMDGTFDARRIELLDQHVTETQEFIEAALDREVGAMLGEEIA